MTVFDRDMFYQNLLDKKITNLIPKIVGFENNREIYLRSDTDLSCDFVEVFKKKIP